MLTMKDIRNSKNQSGYSHVHSNGNRGLPGQGAVMYRAETGPGGNPDTWRGPARKTPEEAAQDYCDYVNGQGIAPAAALKTAGHKGPQRVERSDEERELRKRLRELEAERNAGRKGYVYLIAEDDCAYAVKIGHSYDPDTRPNGLQTGNPRKLIVLAYMEGTLEDEAALHQRYIKDNVLQEWFRPSEALLAEFGLSLTSYWAVVLGERLGNYTLRGSA